MSTKNYVYHFEILKHKILNKNYDLSIENVSALTGISSRIIFFAQLGKAVGDKQFYENLIVKDINNVLTFIEKNQVSPINLNGIVGFGSAVTFIYNLGYLKDVEHTILSELDDFVTEYAKAEFSENNFDFFYGGLGYLNYLILRPKPTKKIINSIKEILSLPFFQKLEQKDFIHFDSDKKGQIDLSGSHGLTSVIHFLNKIISLEIELEKSRIMLANCCTFIIENVALTEQGLRIPDYIDSNQEPNFSPLRWCHGELGIIPILSEAAILLNNTMMSNVLSKVLLTICNFKLTKRQQLVSPNVCHGTLGVAHIFSRLYTKYPLKEVEKAKLYWHKKSLDLITNIGYTDNDDNGVFVEKTGVLLGIEGMALVILSDLYKNEFEWDYLILLS